MLGCSRRCVWGFGHVCVRLFVRAWRLGPEGGRAQRRCHVCIEWAATVVWRLVPVALMPFPACSGLRFLVLVCVAPTGFRSGSPGGRLQHT